VGGDGKLSPCVLGGTRRQSRSESMKHARQAVFRLDLSGFGAACGVAVPSSNEIPEPIGVWGDVLSASGPTGCGDDAHEVDITTADENPSSPGACHSYDSKWRLLCRQHDVHASNKRDRAEAHLV